MNRIASLAIVLGALTGSIFVGQQIGADVRESRLESACIAQGKVPLWQSAGPDDHRTDGHLPFHCVDPR